MGKFRVFHTCCAAALLLTALPPAAEGQPSQTGVYREAELVAGIGATGYSGDGLRATEARLGAELDLAVGRSGILHIADSDNLRVRAVNPDGTIDTVPGTRAVRSPRQGSRESGLGEYHASDFPVAVAAGDRALHVLGHDTLRRIDEDGTVTVTAEAAELYDEDLIRFTDDRGDIAAGPDGAVYLTDTTTDRVIRVDRRGAVTAVAGGGYKDAARGGKATDVRLPQVDKLAVGADGSLYLAQDRGAQVFRVTPAGTLSVLVTLSGAGPAAVAGIAVAPNGDVLVADRLRGLIGRATGEGELEAVTPPWAST
jgi:hypothetical protein